MLPPSPPLPPPSQPEGPPASPPDRRYVSTSFSASGEVSEYDDDRKRRIASVFATEANVPVDDVTILVVSGSVIVTATISVPAASADETAALLQNGIVASPDALQSAMSTGGVNGVTIEDVCSPPAVSASPPSDGTGAEDDSGASSVVMIIAIAAGGTLLIVAVAVVMICHARSRRSSPSVGINDVKGSQVPRPVTTPL